MSRPAELLTLVFISAQLLLVLLVLNEVDLLPLAFRRVVYLASVGFVVNHLLPLRFRPILFVSLSLVAMLLVFGRPTAPDTSWNPWLAVRRTAMLLTIGALLIGICHLPIGFWKRAVLLAVAGAVAGTFRAGIVDSGDLALIWPVLAGMFMFRLMVYLYDLSTRKARPPLWRSVAYFFMLPTACVSLLPIIDFKTMFTSYYREAPTGTYQRGVHWIARGVVQLLIYRYVDQVFAPSARTVYSGVDLVRFLVTNSLTYLNVSGSFHLVIGLLLMFGFSLPEANRRYFLATSFTDYWRRVNVYWKDFMMKTFFYPMYFRLKHRGSTRALIVATLWVFFVTWALHLYQAWWLVGSAFVTWPDTLFWSILCVLVLINSLWELKRGRNRTPTTSTFALGQVVGLSLRTSGTFACICLLWSLWGSPDVATWLNMWKYADRYTALGSVAVVGTIMVAKVAMEMLPTLWNWRPLTPAQVPRAVPLLWGGVQCAAPMIAILAVAQPAVQAKLPDPGAFDQRLSKQRLMDVLEAGDSLRPERNAEELNYYGRLARLDDREPLGMFIGRPLLRIPHNDTPPEVPTRDFRPGELLPLQRASVYETEDFRTNRWGMRDRDYELAKPAHTVRLALLGSSHTMGYAARQDQVFETLVEERLNHDRPADPDVGFEILNFAQVGYSPLSQVNMMEPVGRFKPDVVLLVGHARDFATAANHLWNAERRQHPIPDESLVAVLRDARVNQYVHVGLAAKRLKPFEPALIEWSFRHIAQSVRSMGAIPVYVFVPAVGIEFPVTPAIAEQAHLLEALAARTGFVVIDGIHVFDGHEGNTLVTGVRLHSNAKAHSLVADLLYKHLTTDPRIHLQDRVRQAASH